MSSAPGRREVAHRLFAVEYEAADFQYSEGEEERAPNYVVTPTGARVNRAFVVGVLTEIETVGDEVLRARVVDPTGAFVVYAGQYQPEALAFLESADTPTFVAVTGKARTFSPEDSDRVFTSIRPESINEVDAETRDRWTVDAARHTLARVATFDAALETDIVGEDLETGLEAAGVQPGLAAGIPLAMDRYGTGEHYLASMADVALDALRLVADETDEVPVPDVAPDARGEGTVDRERIAAASHVEPVDPGDVETGAAAAEDAGDPTEPDETADVRGGAGTDAASEETTGANGSDSGEASTSESSVDADATGESNEVGSSATSTEATPEAGAEAAGRTEEGSTGDEGADGPAEEGAADATGESDLGDFDGGGDLGDFEPDESAGSEATGDADSTEDGGETGGTAESGGATTEDAEVPDQVLDDEERERIESEYGTEFQSGTEVDEPGEADIEPEAGPLEPDEAADEEVTGTTGEEAADEEVTGTAGGEVAAEAAEATDEPAEDLDLQSVVVDRMAALDDGDGVDHDVLVEAIVDEYGVDAGDVEGAIEDALMEGQCYEPADGKLSAI